VTVEQLSTCIKNDVLHSGYSEGLISPGFVEQMIKS